jgi:hypothetical protein
MPLFKNGLYQRTAFRWLPAAAGWIENKVAFKQKGNYIFAITSLEFSIIKQ